MAEDYYRYTTSGARYLAESARLVVERVEADGGYAAVLASTLGLGAKHFSDEELGQGLQKDLNKGGWYVSTHMLARKPASHNESRAARQVPACASVKITCSPM